MSITIGSFPPWLASSRACSISAPLAAAASLNPRLLNIMPQHWEEMLRGMITWEKSHKAQDSAHHQWLPGVDETAG